MSRLLVGTNLKMNLTSTELAVYLRDLRARLGSSAPCDVFVLPSFPSLWVARRELEGSGIRWGAQDLHPAEGGAHTGDVSAAMLADLGCRYVQVGHAERRRDHGETDELVGAKLRAALGHRLTPILCVGERSRGSSKGALAFVREQLRVALAGVPPLGTDDLIVAYEPVWAIGAGAVSAPPEHVEAMHAGIHRWLEEHGAGDVRVIYGGSNDEDTAPALIALRGVDGLYVGRAALEPARFAAIADIVAEAGRDTPANDGQAPLRPSRPTEASPGA